MNNEKIILVVIDVSACDLENSEFVKQFAWLLDTKRKQYNADRIKVFFTDDFIDDYDYFRKCINFFKKNNDNNKIDIEDSPSPRILFRMEKRTDRNNQDNVMYYLEDFCYKYEVGYFTYICSNIYTSNFRYQKIKSKGIDFEMHVPRDIRNSTNSCVSCDGLIAARETGYEGMVKCILSSIRKKDPFCFLDDDDDEPQIDEANATYQITSSKYN